MIVSLLEMFFEGGWMRLCNAKVSLAAILFVSFSLGVQGAGDVSSSVEKASPTGLWHAGIEGGVSLLMGDVIQEANELRYNDNSDIGYNVGLSVGYAINTAVTVEGQFFYVKNQGTGYDEGSSFVERVYMGNVIYGFDMGNDVTFSLGLGFGVVDPGTQADSYYHYDNENHADAKFSYQALVGASYALTSQLAFTLGYHCIVPIGTETTAEKPGSLPKINLINAGLRYYF